MSWWIQIRTDLFEDPRVAVIASRCNITVTHAGGACCRFWGIVDREAVKGFLKHITIDALDLKIGIAGFGEALKAVDWLWVVEGGLQMPRWEKYMSNTSKTRAMNAVRMSAARHGHVASTLDARDTHAARTNHARGTHADRTRHARGEHLEQEQEQAAATLLPENPPTPIRQSIAAECADPDRSPEELMDGLSDGLQPVARSHSERPSGETPLTPSASLRLKRALIQLEASGVARNALARLGSLLERFLRRDEDPLALVMDICRRAKAGESKGPGWIIRAVESETAP